MDKNSLVKISEGDVYLWIEQGSTIHLKAVTKSGDPVELTESEAKELAKTLLAMVQRLENK